MTNLVSPVDPNEARHRREIATALNQAIRGKLNAVGTVTLTANAATTTLIDERIGGDSWIGLMPLTANAAGALANIFNLSADITKGQAVITHANVASTDRTFRYVVIG